MNLPLNDIHFSVEDLRQGGAVHTWIHHLSQEATAEAPVVALLSKSELDQAQGFSNPKQRNQYLQVRAQVRKTLASYVGVPPQDLKFSRDPRGKPRLLNADLHFNLSHCSDYLVIAVSHHNLGVDLERLSTQRNWRGIAERYFHADEVTQLNNLPASLQPQGFYQWWTLKEAFFKGRGTGLSTGMDKVSFDFHGELVRYRFADVLAETPENWQFRQWQWEDFYLSLAVQGPSAIPLAVTFFSATASLQPAPAPQSLITQSQPAFP